MSKRETRNDGACRPEVNPFDEADAVLGDYFLGRLEADDPPGRNFTEGRR